MKYPDDNDSATEINIIPMIDVIFFVLAFFMISTLNLTRAEMLSVALPKAKSSSPMPAVRSTVSVSSDQKVYIDREPVSLKQMEYRFRNIAGRTSKPTQIITINADKAVPHGLVVSIIDRITLVPNTRIAIATQR